MKALIVYESMYGNTRAVAEAVAEGMRPAWDVAVVPVPEATAASVKTADLLIVGGPTHVHGMSRPRTRTSAAEAAAKPDSGLALEPHARDRGVREWLDDLAEARDGHAAAFDTRMSGPAYLTGRASLGIGKRLRRRGFDTVTPPMSFLVDKENRLLAEQLGKARAWGAMLAESSAGESSITVSAQDQEKTRGQDARQDSKPGM